MVETVVINIEENVEEVLIQIEELGDQVSITVSEMGEKGEKGQDNYRNKHEYIVSHLLEQTRTLSPIPTNPSTMIVIVNGFTYLYGRDFNVLGSQWNWVSPLFSLKEGYYVTIIYS